MIYTEVKQDLFEVDHTYYLPHCISADFGMAKGIAVQFNYNFDDLNSTKFKTLVSQFSHVYMTETFYPKDLTIYYNYE